MTSPRYLPAVMLTVLALAVAALAVTGMPLPAWPPVIAVAGLLACALTAFASACLDMARLVRSAGRHVRRVGHG